LRFSVVGTDHLHVVELVSGLLDAGAQLVAIAATEDRIGPWLATQHEGARSVPDLDAALDGVDVVVTAAVPSGRTEIGILAMRAGKDVLADKPGATSLEQLDALRTTCTETGRQYLVLFTERLTNASMVRAYDLVRDGRVGEVVHTVGLGPHTLNLTRRPEWFYDPEHYGGILVDIGSHQVDQFLAFTGSTGTEVLASTVRSHSEHPGVEVLGEMLLAGSSAAGAVTGYARVDYLTPAGLAPAWGDVRFTVVGTEGYLEVRSVDQTVLVVDGDRQETIACTEEPSGWGARYLDGTLVTQEHVFTVTETCLRAQAGARRAGIDGIEG
jgi:predicted dehydrogenase